MMAPATAEREKPMSEESPRAAWPQDLQEAFSAGEFSGCVGSVLVSETDKVRVWHLHIPKGKRCGFHRHVLNYFWTCLGDGRARNYYEDGRTAETPHYKGQTRHLQFGPDEYMVHCVENVGETDLNFTTVEFLDSPNQALPVPDNVRLKVAA
jgi:oxalate decarboxylase/phosphoglucose isomerase-like protein (cupin superfamily)